MRELNIGEPFLTELGKNLEAVDDKVDAIEDLLADIDIEEEAQKASYVIARDELLFTEDGSTKEAIATQVLVEVAMAACADTREYDYDLFLERLSKAIVGNSEYIFATHNQTESVKVDLSYLGTTEQWAKAAREAYETGSRTQVHEESGENLAARLWREKLYKPAREGIAPPEREKKRKSTSKLADELEEGISKTEKKEDKIAKAKVRYRETIQNRFAELGENEAPFWELINDGNMAFDPLAYPTFGATNFVTEADRILSMLFKESINLYVPKIEKAIRKLMIKEVDLRAGEKIAESEEEFKEDVVIILEEELEELMEGGRPRPGDRRTSTIIYTIDTTYEAIIINEQSHLRGRDPETGYFKSIVLGE